MARRWPAMALMVVMAVAGVVSAMPDVVSMEAEDGGLPDGAAHAQIEDLRQRSDDAAASLRALKMERKHRLTTIRAQRAAEMKRLKKQHAVELAAERQQAKYEWHDLMSQHRTELQKLKAKVAIQQRVTARVTREIQEPVMKTPEVKRMLAQQKQEAAQIKKQRRVEVAHMQKRFAWEMKSQQNQQKRDIAYALKTYAAKLKRRQEQLAFFRFQESEASESNELGEGVDVDSMSASNLRHEVLSLKKALHKQQGKYHLLLNANAVARKNKVLQEKVRRLKLQNEHYENDNTKLKTKLETMENVFQPHKKKAVDGVTNAEAVMAVP